VAGRRTQEAEVRLAQYELPAFRAGAAAGLVRQAIWLLDRGCSQQAAVVLDDALDAIHDWMRMAQAITSYQYAGELVAQEG